MTPELPRAAERTLNSGGNDVQERFVLLGHDCPLGCYPAPVVPIGRLSGCLVACFSSADYPRIESIPEGSRFVAHDGLTRHSLAAFDLNSDRLFAHSATDVVSYKADREGAFFEHLLESPRFSSDNPFLRLSLARATGQVDLIRREAELCLRSLQLGAKELIPQWLTSLRDIPSLAETVLRDQESDPSPSMKRPRNIASDRISAFIPEKHLETHSSLDPARTVLVEMARRFSFDRTTIRRGSNLFRQQVAATHLYLIEEGLVKLTHVSNTSRTILSVCGRGSIVGDEAILESVSTYSGEAQALTDSVAYEIPRESMRHLLTTSPILSSHILIETLRGKQEMAKRAALLASSDVEHRLLYYLSDLAKLLPPTKDGLHQIPISQLELAELIGATRETTSTCLALLRGRGLLQLSRRLLIVSPNLWRDGGTLLDSKAQ